MRILVIAVGNKMPAFVTMGFQEYQKRFPRAMTLELVEIPMGRRGTTADVEKLTAQEGRQMLAQVPKGALIVTLDIPGRMYSTPELAEEVRSWKMSGRDVAILIGGPEGLSPECRKAAEKSWSLSRLTMPHPLVRIVMAESLYRAWSITANLPYHRE